MLNTKNEEAADALLLTNGAARLLDVSPQTIRTWEKSGRLRALKTESGVRLFLRRDLIQFAAERDRQAAEHSA